MALSWKFRKENSTFYNKNGRYTQPPTCPNIQSSSLHLYLRLIGIYSTISLFSTTVLLKLSLALSMMRRGLLLGRSREISRDTERNFNRVCQCFLYFSLRLFTARPSRTQNWDRQLIRAMLRSLTMQGCRHQYQVDLMLCSTITLARRHLTQDTDEGDNDDSSSNDSLASFEAAVYL